MNKHPLLLGFTLLAAGCASYAPQPVSHPAPAKPAESAAQPSPLTALPPAKPEQIPQQYGGYYKDDGPILEVPYDLDALREPVPVAEPLNTYANKPYTVLGKTYTPRKVFGDFSQEGMASWYGKKFHGKRTSSGETYDLFKLTAAHPVLPIPSFARVTNLSNGKSVVVRVNDRGPFHRDRVIDLSYAAAYRLGYQNNGSARVRVDALLPGDTQPKPSQEAVLVQAVEAAAGLPVMNEPPTAVDPLARLVDTVTAEPPAQPVIEASADQRWVQLGAFGTQTTAEAFRAKVADSLTWLSMAPVVEAAGNVWRVRLGPFTSKQAAQQAADRIAASADLRPVVMR